HLMEDTLLGRDDERVLFALPGEPADRTRRADEVCVPQNGLLTFRVSQNWRIRVTNLQPDELLLAEDLVYDARAVPEHHVPPGLLRKEAAEVAIRCKNDRLVLGDLPDDVLGVRRRHNDVGEGFRRRCAVDVGNQDVPRALVEEGSKFLGP